MNQLKAGVEEVRPPVCYWSLCRPEPDERTSGSEGPQHPIRPPAASSLFFGYNDIQDGFEEPSQLGGHDKRGRPTFSISTATYCPHQPHQR
jgi:hypothetical protein